MSNPTTPSAAARLHHAVSSACPAIPDTVSHSFPQVPASHVETPPSQPQPTPANPRDLTPQQLLAATLLALGHSDTDTARRLHIDRRTIYNWKHHNPLFQSHLNATVSDLWDTAASRIRSSLLRAVNELNRQLKDDDKLTRFRAARTFLTSAASRTLAPAAPLDPTQILDEMLAAHMNRQFPGMNCPAHMFPQHLRDQLLALLLANQPIPHPDTFLTPHPPIGNRQ